MSCPVRTAVAPLTDPTTISTPGIRADSLAGMLSEAQARNFDRWPILGTYVWPNPSPIPTTYAGEILELKAFISARWQWLGRPGRG